MTTHDDAAASWRDTLPMTIALIGVGSVWALGCWWSFAEQRAFAIRTGFGLPFLLPLVLDGLAAAMAGVAYAASLDGRPAIGARLGTALAVVASAASNGTFAYERSGGDPATVTIAIGIPVAANVAFEVLLGELRRRVQRSRGLPAPPAVPAPRMVRLALDPLRAFGEWRRLVLALTEPDVGTSPKEDEQDARPIPSRAPVPITLAPSHRATRDGIAGPPPPWTGRTGTAVPSRPVPIGEQDDRNRPEDAEIVSQLRSRDVIPGIGAIAAEFGIGKTRAGRLQRDARGTVAS